MTEMQIPTGSSLSRIGWDDYFMGIAFAVGRRADCRRRMVGAVLVELTSNRVMATGYNGAPSKSAESCLDRGCPRGLRTSAEIKPGDPYDGSVEGGRCISVHAEANALMYAFRGFPSMAGTMYVTTEPCPDCWKLMAAAAVHRVVWLEGNRLMERKWINGAWTVCE